jgi:hypothetical protein
MEKPNNIGGKNSIKSILLIISCVSWLLVAVNNLASLKWMYNGKKDGVSRSVWNILILSNGSNIKNILIPSIGYIPLQMNEIMIYIVFNFYYAIIFIGCVVYIIKTLIKKDQQIIEGMMGTISQFHFFPLLCAFAMTLLGEIYDEDIKKRKNIAFTGLVISIVGVATLIFIYINTNFKNNVWWTKFCLKEGTFSCLIILFWYNFCYVIYQARILDKPGKDIDKWRKGCSLAFSIIFGIGSIAFSYVFKDIMVSFMNILIYIGLVIQYFGIDNTSIKDYNKNGDGAIDMIILMCSIILFLYLVIDYIKNEIIEIKSQIYNLGQVQTQTIVKVNANSEQINFISNNIDLPVKEREILEQN